MRLIRDGEKVGEGGMEVGGEGDYIPIATEGALFISAQLSSDAVSTLRKVRVLI